MRKGKYKCLLIIVLFLSSLSASILVSIIMAKTYASSQYKLISSVTDNIIKHYPEAKQDILRMIKDSINTGKVKSVSTPSVLSEYGYTKEIFEETYLHNALLTIIVFFSILFVLLLILYLFIRKANRLRVSELTTYLESFDHDDGTVLPLRKEDDYSQLEDEIYKTVTKLRQTRETAVKERQNLADNLADLSHQIKTPVASISLMTQLLDSGNNHEYTQRIQNQSAHLEQLIEALLTLSRIDAGALRLAEASVDIYTMLQISIETIEVMLLKKRIQVTLPNHPELTYTGDMEWSIEAFSNLLKNCTEHTPEGGSIILDYHQNPLYLEITIKDSGSGFSEKDLPHLFERFYRGENASVNGCGIGLSLAKAIIEKQNGILSAKNIPNEGACFIVRFYCH